MSRIKAWICLSEGTHVLNLDSKVDCLWKHCCLSVWNTLVLLCLWEHVDLLCLSVGTLWFYFAVCGNTLILLCLLEHVGFLCLWEHLGFSLFVCGNTTISLSLWERRVSLFQI